MNTSYEMRFKRGIYLTPELYGYDHDEDGKLVVSGILNIGTAYGPVEVTELKIKNDGLDIENGCNVSSYSFVLYGYNVV